MNEDIRFFDWWIHLLEVLVVMGIGLVIWAAKKKKSHDTN